MNPKTKNMLLFATALVLLASAVVIAFRDSIFTGGDSTTPEVRALVEQAAKNTEAPAAEPPKSNFHKHAQKVGGN